MPNARPSLIRRALVQMDLAFWYLHAHPADLAVLGLPTLVAISGLAVTVVGVLQAWDLPWPLLYVLFGVAVPTALLWLMMFAPLPSAVFAWRRAGGTLPSTNECFSFVTGRALRLAPKAISIFFLLLLGVFFLGLPLLAYGPRISLVPIVVLFENESRAYRRSSRLLKEDLAIRLLAALYFGLSLVMALLLSLPRLFLLMTSKLGSGPNGLLETPASRWIWDHLWIVESLGGGTLLAVISVAWCVSMTLLYRDIRMVREGERLRGKLESLRQQLTPGTAVEAGARP